jgi:hypothetical protein
MNELHKYATFSVDLLGTPNKINSVFSMGRARIFYKGINRNRSIIDGEVAEQLASTIPGTPVIGTYNYETNDFEGHEENPSAFGFIPLDPHPTWVSENDKEYLEVDVVIWDGRFEEAQDILTNEKHLSMELNPRTMKGTFERKGSTTYYRVTYAEFAGITVLGDDVEPCFEDAQFITAFSNMVSAYALYIEETQRNIEGGNDVMDNINEIVEPEVTTDAVVEEVETEVVEETVEVEATETVVETEAEVEEVEAEEEVAEETEIVETVEAPEAVEFEAAEDDKSKCEAEEEACEKCGKNPCVCESSLDEEDKEEADEKDDEEEKPEEEEDKKDYQALYAELSAKYESLETKYDEALNSLNKYTKKEKLEIINKFSTKLESEELIEKLTNEVDNYSLEEIKTELGHALVEQMSAEEDAAEETSPEANFSLNINIADNNLGNTAWDLVKRHKQGK